MGRVALVGPAGRGFALGVRPESRAAVASTRRSRRRGCAGGCDAGRSPAAAPRSALAPVPDLRAAIVVDDADEALQEERSPTWHARDVLFERAARAAVPFTVCSPAPTVEALVAAAADSAVAFGRTMNVEAPPADVE